MRALNSKRLLLCILVVSISYAHIQAQQRKQVTAEFIENVIYNTDYVAHKSKDGYLICNDKIYVSLDEICLLLDKSYALNTNVIRLMNILEDQELDESLTNMYYNHAIVEEINLIERTIILQVETSEGNKELITLTLTQDIQIQHEVLENIFPVEVLKKGMHVTAITQIGKMENGHNVASTIIIEERNEIGGLTPNLINVKIKEINREEEYLCVELEDPYNGIKEIIVHVDHHTNIKFLHTNKEATLAVLKPGMYIDIKTNSILTDSNPPHTIGLELLIKTEI